MTTRSNHGLLPTALLALATGCGSSSPERRQLTMEERTQLRARYAESDAYNQKLEDARRAGMAAAVDSKLAGVPTSCPPGLYITDAVRRPTNIDHLAFEKLPTWEGQRSREASGHTSAGTALNVERDQPGPYPSTFAELIKDSTPWLDPSAYPYEVVYVILRREAATKNLGNTFSGGALSGLALAWSYADGKVACGTALDVRLDETEYVTRTVDHREVDRQLNETLIRRIEDAVVAALPST